jgi:hypothetical protein
MVFKSTMDEDLIYDLSSQRLGLQTMEKLRTVFSAVPSGTRRLRLDGNYFHLKTGLELAELMALLPDSVEEIDFKLNSFQLQLQITSLFDALQPGVSIDLSYNNLHQKTGAELTAMFAALQPGVTVLLAGNNFHQKTGAVFWR